MGVDVFPISSRKWQQKRDLISVSMDWGMMLVEIQLAAGNLLNQKNSIYTISIMKTPEILVMCIIDGNYWVITVISSW